MEVQFNKLDESQRQVYETLIIENDVKFHRNKTDGRYVALLKIDKDAMPTTRPKSPQQSEKRSLSPRVRPRIAHAHHEGCPDNEIVPRKFSPYRDPRYHVKEIKTKEQILAETARMNSTGPHSARAINYQEGKTINIARSAVLENYKDAFPEVEMERLLFTPVHISYLFLVRRIELFYNVLFNIVQRHKTLEAVNLSRAISEYYQKEYQTSLNYYHQNLANLLYSGHKQADKPEIETFMTFVGDKPGSLDLLYFLYVRQFVKVITGNFLLKLDDIDPSKIALTRAQVNDIVQQSLYFDEAIQSRALNAVNEAMGANKTIAYYEFLELMLQQKIDLEVDLPANGPLETITVALSSQIRPQLCQAGEAGRGRPPVAIQDQVSGGVRGRHRREADDHRCQVT
jgi:hypothetical protein